MLISVLPIVVSETPANAALLRDALQDLLADQAGGGPASADRPIPDKTGRPCCSAQAGRRSGGAADVVEEARPLGRGELEGGAGAVKLGVPDADRAVRRSASFDATTVWFAVP
jgi:hypothetical protein